MEDTPATSIVKVLLAAALITAMVASVVWARKGGGRARAALAGSLLFLFGGAIAPPKEQLTIEEAKEAKGKKGAESGDPPADPSA